MAEVSDQLDRPSSTLTRGDLLRRGGAAAFAVSMFGGLSDRALGFYGPLKFANKQLAGDDQPRSQESLDKASDPGSRS